MYLKDITLSEIKKPIYITLINTLKVRKLQKTYQLLPEVKLEKV